MAKSSQATRSKAIHRLRLGHVAGAKIQKLYDIAADEADAADISRLLRKAADAKSNKAPRDRGLLAAFTQLSTIIDTIKTMKLKAPTPTAAEIFDQSGLEDWIANTGCSLTANEIMKPAGQRFGSARHLYRVLGAVPSFGIKEDQIRQKIEDARRAASKPVAGQPDNG